MAWHGYVSGILLAGRLSPRLAATPLGENAYTEKVDSVEESEDEAKTTVPNLDTGECIIVPSDFAAGCDGAS